MFNKLKVIALNKLIKKTNPGREIEFGSIGSLLYRTDHDIVGARDYLLKGKYSYDKVVELNKLTGENHVALFGYNEKMGPVAFIGLYTIFKTDEIRRNGYFYPHVRTYDQIEDYKSLPFDELVGDDAKEIENYTVYGKGDPRPLNGIVPIDKVTEYYDYRDIIKTQTYKWEIPADVLTMERRLAGTYSFADAWYFATGYKGEFHIYDRGEPIQFAIVGDNKPVGIIGLFGQEEHLGKMFKDVWEYNKEEPINEPIRFLTKEEASKINNFKLYVFKVHTYDYRRKINSVETEAVDRTFNKNFDFTLEDGTDYRLQTVKKNDKQYTKTK